MMLKYLFYNVSRENDIQNFIPIPNTIQIIFKYSWLKCVDMVIVIISELEN